MSIVIRPAVAGDSESVFALVSDFSVSFRPTAATFARSFAQLIRQNDALLVVGDEAGRAVGYLLAFEHPALFADGRVAWIEEIAVRGDRRRQGIGRQLMEAFEGWARARSVLMAALATRRAGDFYAALGYEASATYFRKIL